MICCFYFPDGIAGVVVDVPKPSKRPSDPPVVTNCSATTSAAAMTGLDPSVHAAPMNGHDSLFPDVDSVKRENCSGKHFNMFNSSNKNIMMSCTDPLLWVKARTDLGHYR